MAHSVKYRKRLMVNGEQLRDHALIRLPFTLYRLPRRYALGALRFAANEVSYDGQLTSIIEIASCGPPPQELSLVHD